MSNKNLFRLISRTSAFFKNYQQTPRTIQCLAQRPMSTNVSIHQIGKEKEAFQDVLPGILDRLVNSPKLSQVPELGTWVRKMVAHNLSGGKHSRGLMTMLSYEMLEKPENISEESVRLSRVLGWCVEMLQAYFLVLDDIMDGSATRRGVPCWYLTPGVGLGAINDAILIQSCIMETIETYFSKWPQHVDIIRLFNETILYTAMGQHLDYTTAHNNKNDYSLFTIDRYNSIVKYKTACYTFRLPVFLGMLMLKDVNKSMYGDVDEICMDLGRLFQIQDDYIDVYGDETITGKAGTDIQEGKCSWLAVTALQRCNAAQRDEFTLHYGSKKLEDIQRIKWLYEDLKIPELYRTKEMEIHDDMVRRVRTLPSETAPNFFYKLIDRIYKRKH